MSLITPWSKKKEETKEIQGDEKIIQEQWELYEKLIYAWIWYWVLR